MPRIFRNFRGVRSACAAFCGLMLASFAAHAGFENIRNQQTEDFGYFYQAARAMLEGRDIYAAAGGHYIYPPFIAFIFQPLAFLPEVAASIVWSALAAVIIFVALLLASNESVARWRPEAGPALPWLIMTISLVLLGEKFHANFTLGQTDSLMLLGFVCTFLWMERRPFLAGLVAGATANIKYLSLIFVPYFLLKRNYRAVAASLAGFLFFLALPVVELGPVTMVRYLANAFSGLAKMAGLRLTSYGNKIHGVDWERSLSFTSATFRFTRAYQLPDAVALVLLVLSFAGIMGAIWLICRRQGVPIFRHSRLDSSPSSLAVASLEWCVLLFLAVVFSPQTTARHMILLALVITIALGVLFVPGGRNKPRIFLMVALGIMVFALSFPFPALGLKSAHTFWRAASGASFCALFLILILLWAGSRALAQTRGRLTSPPN